MSDTDTNKITEDIIASLNLPKAKYTPKASTEDLVPIDCNPLNLSSTELNEYRIKCTENRKISLELDEVLEGSLAALIYYMLSIWDSILSCVNNISPSRSNVYYDITICD